MSIVSSLTKDFAYNNLLEAEKAREPFVPLSEEEKVVLSNNRSWSFSSALNVFETTLVESAVLSGAFAAGAVLWPAPAEIISVGAVAIAFLSAAKNICKQHSSIKAAAYMMRDNFQKRPLRAVGDLLPKIAFDHAKQERVDSVVLTPEERDFLQEKGYKKSRVQFGEAMIGAIGAIPLYAFSSEVSSLPGIRFGVPLAYVGLIALGIHGLTKEYKKKAQDLLKSNSRPIKAVAGGNILDAVSEEDIDARVRETTKVRVVPGGKGSEYVYA